MDSFKGSLTSQEAGEAVRRGILAADVRADVLVFPFADGGEGTLDAFLTADGGSRRVTVSVSDPLGRQIEASYGVLSDDTVVIEMAQAAGLCLLADNERDPMYTTTRGVGQLVRHAINAGYRKYIIALGGSSTNDCGAGMLQELGLRIDDEAGNPITDGVIGLSDASSVDDTGLDPKIRECDVMIACDVDNPLCGPSGASHVFAPQKGASPEDVVKMDSWISHFAQLIKEKYPDADPSQKGAGAAGGLGFALQTFFDGKIRSGADVLLERTGLAKEIEAADLVITGEGKIDGQTAEGKAPACIARISKKYGKSVIAIAGSVGAGYEKCLRIGIDAVYPVTPDNMDRKEAMKKDVAIKNIERTAGGMIRDVLQSEATGLPEYQ